MTADEFNRWKDSFFAAFPGTLEWLNKTSPDPAATLGFWFKSLAKTDYGDALEAIDRLLTGDKGTAPIAAFDRDKTALIVASIANRCLRDRLKVAEVERLEAAARQPKSRGGFMPGAAYVRAMRVKKAAMDRGETIEQAREAFNAEMYAALGESNRAEKAEWPEPVREF